MELSLPICPEASNLGLPTSSISWKGRDEGYLMPSQHLPRWRDFFCQCEARPLSEYLSLDTVQAPEPEDLASAQLHLCMVNLIQPLCILGDLLFGDAMPSLL